MSIFKRSKKSDPAGRAGEVDGVETLEGQDPVDTDADGTQADGDAAGDDAVTRTASVVLDRSEGPFDASEVDGRGGRVDLGALWMQGVPGMELRLEVDQNTQQVNAAMAVIGDSALQVQAFAAPRSGGLWDEIRAELVTAIEAQGGTAEERVGPLGTELRTRMPSRGENGRTVFAPATFLGVDGPRWFLRGVLSGRAAIDDDAAAPLLEVLRAAVVVRGTEPMAPRELLPLALPREAERAAEAAEAEADAEDEAERTSLDPFTRGPEITEVR
ncbi:DUF3710 domain-containing protein [Ornithinibacter sp.]|uniref:DUF3710 domain-containing protein n=1 Tax=Ornithinibacter sp. TaxID=2862748 RepID=UPI002BC801C6|nr:DUF3710 domain-containing protein [Ornithinibacter sp.]HQZ10303.1 DUF3710 domain-containing protein [Ornithinibacter sp.]HRA26305.1 DUF3710 domain-containing protein [Ornithinibacter sp.]